MDFSSNVLWHLASVAIRSLALAGLALLALAVFRVRAAAARHAVWTVATAAMLTMAVCEPLLPPLAVPVMRALPEPTVAVSLPVPVDPAPAAAAISAPPQSVQPVWPTWPQALAAVYAIGLLALLVRLAFGYLFTRRLVRASRPIDRPWAANTFESTWISVPLTVGWRRAKILLPANWRQWDDAKLQAVLAHERTHVERADWAIAVLAGVNRCVFWFHPLAWWLEHRLAFLAEQACDDAALMLVETGSYAQALLDMAAAVKSGQGRLVWEAMAMANAAEVRKRIERILDETRQIPRGLTASRRWALVAASLPLIYMASVLRPEHATAQQAAAQQPAATPPAIAELLQGRKPLAAGDVTTMEQYLASNPQDLDARTQLVLHYFANTVREPRLSHIFWMIANHPESTQAAFVSRGILARTTVFNDAADFARASALWKQQAASHASDARVLENAAEFLGQPGGDPDEAERLLLAARGTRPAANINDLKLNEKLGKLYASAILGESGDPRFPSLNAAFASHVRQQLENSSDPMLLHFAGAALANVAQRTEPRKALQPGVLNLDDHPMLVPAVDLGNRLLAKSRELGGPNGLRYAMLSTVPRTAGPAAPVPANPTLPSPPPLVHKVDPEYPALARVARIQGVVKLLAGIGADGHVTNVQVIMGQPLLAQAAMAAVKQWVYSPIPAAGTVELDVPFDLPPGDASAPPAVIGGVTSAPGNASAATLPSLPPLVNRVEPVYPALAQQARIQGTIKLMTTIGTDGHITHLEVISGHPLLVPAALDAVKQWVFVPIPSAGTAVVEVPFSLAGVPPPPPLPPGTDSLTPRKGSGVPRIRIGGAVQAAKLDTKVDPVYPSEARAAGITGAVTLEVVIGQDGHVESVQPADGNPILATAAADAVKQWVYQPTLLNGAPCMVLTTVTVTFQ